MKYIIIVGDGMADWPIKELSGKTPLEAAKKPNIDFIARNGKCGLLRTLKGGLPLGSDIANLSILGYEPEKYYSGGRGPIEAASMGLKMGGNDIALRCNLITEENGVIRDYGAGHISTDDAGILIKEINGKLGTADARFYPGKSYRHIMILKSNRFSDKIRCMPPHDIMGQKVDLNLIKAEDKEGEDTAGFLNRLILASKEILENHAINKERIKNGKLPANMFWLWGAGKKPNMPKFREKFGINGALISAVDLLNGIAVCLGMEIPNVPGATGYVDTNYEGKADAAINALEKNDLVYVHVEAADEMGHEGDINGKIKAIEDLDKRLVGRMLKSVEDHIRIAILTDHATPIKARTHTPDPVPFAIYSGELRGDNLNYDENSAKRGSYGLREGTEFMKLMLS